tara:strand:- start:207 stop:524 length:318 start_codon:yes stop_codon:yes gene_type:complete
MEIRTVGLKEDGSFIINKNVDADDDRQIGIPNDMGNRHRRKLQVWIDAGNTPEPYVPPVPTYQELRVQAYPPIGDQLDALWKGGQPEADMKLIIDGVKATHPKVI